MMMAACVWLLAAASASAFYNPQPGRWLNRDPIGENGGQNLEGFVFNNPISLVDSIGTFAIPMPPYPLPIHILPVLIPPPILGPGDTVPTNFTGIALCQRPLNEPNLLEKCLNRCGQGHKFLGRFENGKPIAGFGFYERGVTQEPNLSCPWARPCKFTNNPLLYGPGAPTGATGKTASLDLILDCIKTRPRIGAYDPPWNDCRHWPARAAADCGLDCGQ